MNADDRKELANIQVDLNDLINEVENLLETVQDKAENLLEYFPNSDKYERLNEETEILENMVLELDGIRDDLDSLED